MRCGQVEMFVVQDLDIKEGRNPPFTAIKWERTDFPIILYGVLSSNTLLRVTAGWCRHLSPVSSLQLTDSRCLSEAGPVNRLHAGLCVCERSSRTRRPLRSGSDRWWWSFHQFGVKLLRLRLHPDSIFCAFTKKKKKEKDFQLTEGH